MLLGINSTRKAIEIALLVLLIPNITVTRAITHTNYNIIATKTIIIVKNDNNNSNNSSKYSAIQCRCSIRYFNLLIFYHLV